MISYVCGFLFDNDLTHIALIDKLTPSFMAGTICGIGGKVEENEPIRHAMMREFEEEAGLRIIDWKHFCVLRGNDYQIDFFCNASDKVWQVKTMTAEKVAIHHINTIRYRLRNTLPNMHWLLPMAINAINDTNNTFYMINET
jgi:8-oxo-dGTP diphosphatase